MATKNLAVQQSRRSRAGLLAHKRAKAKGMFARRGAPSIKQGLPSRLTFQATTLTRFSSLTRRGLKRLQRRAAHRRGKFLRRQITALSRQQRPVAASSPSILEARERASRALRPFTENLISHAALAPLTFIRRTRRVIKTEAEKQRAVV